MQRKIAFCVGTWSADSTLFSWTYAKQYFLRKQRDEQGIETLSDLDKLYIVHVTSGKAKDKWDAGGPILPRLSQALSKYPHQIMEIEGRDTAAAILDFASKEEIDVIILGSREHKGAMQKMVPGVSTSGSTSDIVKARCKCPCLIIRPSSARNEKMRIKSMVNLGQLLDNYADGAEGSLPLPVKASVLTATAPPEPRKVCIAFEQAEPGNNITAWAAKHCLFPDDDIHLVQITNRSPLEKMQKSTSFQKAIPKFKTASSIPDPGIADSCEEVGKEELQGFDEPLRAHLKGDAKSELCEYLDRKSVDLLIVGFSAANRFKKAFAGGSVSSYMLHHAPCPVVVLPLKSMAWEEHDTLSELRPAASGFDVQAGPNSDDGSTSPPALASLGPRVSMSRIPSSQLQQSKEQIRTWADSGRSITTSAPVSPSFPPASSASDELPAMPQRLSSAGGSLGQEKLTSMLEADNFPHFGKVTSPFMGPARVPRHSRESTDSQGHAVRGSLLNETLSPQDSSETAQLRVLIEAKDAEINALKVQVRQLKLQLAAIQGNSSSGRVILSAT